MLFQKIKFRYSALILVVSFSFENIELVSAMNDALSHDEVGYPSFMSPHTSPIAESDGFVYVVNTPSDTVDVIDTESKEVVDRIPVGIDPVSMAVRPDGKELWVSNHISDSISVIDIDSISPTFRLITDTIQDIDEKTKATKFDEPVGIAFAGNKKAYVALSSENQIAVVDVNSRKITKKIFIPAQDPRAIVVRDDKLYVIPFESNNKTQLSGGNKIDGDLVTFNAWEHSIRVNNVLSIGHVVDIVKHPRVPDRDLFIFDTETDELVESVDTLGTLLYGLTVGSEGQVYIAQTDARNDVNGRSGSKKHSLAEMENRAFLNQITEYNPNVKEGNQKRFLNLEPLPPNHPSTEDTYATPFAIQISNDDSSLFVTAAGSDKLFSVDAASGVVMGSVRVGAVPRGIALVHNDAGKAIESWVFNAVENSVSLVDVSTSSQPKLVVTIALEDPTHPSVKRGRIAFNTASASTTHTFSCASCHPDGHTDQLLWVLKTPVVTGGNQIMPRSTMPIRGLRNTEPYHWDGIPGDPYGGNNSANIHGSDDPNSSADDPTTSTRHLIDGGLASTMALVGDKTINDEGKSGLLSAAQRDDMAKFLLSVPFPPAQRRSYTNELSDEAKRGFDLFHIKGDNDPKQSNPNICGNCHRMPFWVSTNTPGTGMDAPTWRGAYDRFLILPQGRLNIIDFDFYRRVAERGQDERSIWQFSWGGRRRFNPVWNMVLEGSTGYSGAFARQVSLNKNTAKQEGVETLMAALEKADKEGAVVFEGQGILLGEEKSDSIKFQYNSSEKEKGYISMADNSKVFSREDLLTLASQGKFVGTFTARHGAKATIDTPQPAIWTRGPIHAQRGPQKFPYLYGDNKSMLVSGMYIEEGANVIVDGHRVPGDVRLGENNDVTIELEVLPVEGMHLLQIQNAQGLFSNDFIFHVADEKDKQRLLANELEQAASRGNLELVRKLIAQGAPVNQLDEENNSALISASFRGHNRIVRFLVGKGADVSIQNGDGNTPLHVSAWAGKVKTVKLLVQNGADLAQKNNSGETPRDMISSSWSEDLAGVYRYIARVTRVKLDLEQIQKTRPALVEYFDSLNSDNSKE